MSDRTLLTEVKSYLVDAKTKTPTFAQTVSTKIVEGDDHHSDDFTLAPFESKTIANVMKAFQLNSWSPIDLTFVQTGPVLEPEQPPTIPDYITGSIAAINFVSGQPLNITVTDSDIPLLTPFVPVVVYNTVSGETEQVQLYKVQNGIYSGSVATAFASDGISFDEVLHCRHEDVIRIIYQDTRNDNAVAQNVELEVTAFSPYVDSAIHANEFVFPGRPIAILVVDSDLTGTGSQLCALTNMTTLEEETVTLIETSDGIFTASVPTAPVSTTMSGDGIMEVEIGHSVRLVFVDNQPLTQPEHVAVVEVREETYSNGIITISNTVSPDSNAAISLFDYDLANAVYIDVAVSNVRTGEFEYVRCTTAVEGSGNFSGVLQLVSTPSVSGDGKLSVIIGDSIRAAYVDVNTTAGPSAVVEQVSVVVPAIVLEEEEEEEIVEEEPPVVFEPQQVSFTSNGLFCFNGSFNGHVVVTAKEKSVRCKLTYV